MRPASAQPTPPQGTPAQQAVPPQTPSRETPAQSNTTASTETPSSYGFIWPLTLNGDTIKVSCEYLDTVYHPKVHRGIDIRAPRWTEIHSIADGTVLFTVSGKVEGDGDKGRGNFVIINHGNGYRAIYQHNIENNVVPGNKVFQDDVIAFVGNTGLSTGPHLHLEIMEGVSESAKADFQDHPVEFKDVKYHKKDPRAYLPPTNY
jgi:murein DD-endopeptidase MepM/ murein hydrolase activator NlpD